MKQDGGRTIRIQAVLAVLIVAGLAVPGIPQDRPAESLDLSRAIEMALARNRDLARSTFGTSVSALNIIRAESAFRLDVRPELYLDAAGGRTAAGGGLSVSGKLPWGTRASVEGFLAGVTGDGPALRQQVLRVEISQPLFRNFGALVQREPVVQARQDYRAALRALETEKSVLALRVIESYESILQLGRRLLVEQASVDRMDKLVRLARAREGLGRTTRVDTLRAEFLRGQAQFRLETIRESYSFEQRDFAELLGADPDTVFDLKPTVLLEVSVPPLEESLKTALRNRLDYAQALQDAEDALRGVRIAKRRLLPGLNLVAGKSWTGGDAAVAAANADGSVGLSLDMSLNRKEERAALEQARLFGASADLNISIVELAVAREVNQQRAAYRRARAALDIAERNKDLASSRRLLAQRLFELGRADPFSVTDAEETFLEAENQWLSARAEASLAGYRLLYVLGTLVETPDDLKPRKAVENR